jgi:hypothetical protein
MKLGVVTLWTNGRQEEPLTVRRSPSAPPPPMDVLAPTVKPLFALDSDRLLADAVELPASTDPALDLRAIPPARKTKRGQRSRKRAPRSNRGRAA